MLYRIISSNNRKVNNDFDLFTFDIETVNLNPKNFLYGVIFGRFNTNEVENFEIIRKGIYSGIILRNISDIEKIVKILAKRKKNVFIFSHNGFKFDFKILEEVSFWEKIKVKKAGNKLLELKYKNIHFRDSLYYLPLSLKKLGQTVGIFKKVKNLEVNVYDDVKNYLEEVCYDFSSYSIDSLLSKKGIEYCFYDALILYVSLKKLLFLKFKNIDFYKVFSFAELSYRHFTENYINNGGYVKFDKVKYIRKKEDNIAGFMVKRNDNGKELGMLIPVDFDNRFINLYFGGRCEILKYYNTKKYVLHYDINSLYPFCMLYEFPNLNFSPYAISDTVRRKINKSTMIGEKSEILEELFNLYYIVADIEIIDTPNFDKKIPLFCERFGEKLLFFNVDKRYKRVMLHDELKYLNENGYCFKIKNMMRFSKIYPFREFIQSSYVTRQKLKKQGNPFEVIYKLLMNSLYGKFGQRNGDYPSNHTCFLWASTITSRARLTLTKYLHELIKAGYDLLYCDTDSIFIEIDNIEDIKNVENILPVSNKLGELKREGIYRKFVAYNPKVYFTEDVKGKANVKFKGVRKEEIASFLEKHIQKRIFKVGEEKLTEVILYNVKVMNLKRKITKFPDTEPFALSYLQSANLKELKMVNDEYFNKFITLIAG
jgi:DNA polymerase elongation subunit (family B)